MTIIAYYTYTPFFVVFYIQSKEYLTNVVKEINSLKQQGYKEIGRR